MDPSQQKDPVNITDENFSPPFGNIPFVELFFASDDRTSGESYSIPLMDYKSAGYGVGVANNDDTGSPPAHRLFLISLVHTLRDSDTVGGHKITLSILDPEWDYLTDLTCQKFSRLTGFSVRYGWRGIDDKRVTTRIQIPFNLDDISAELVPMKGSIITIHGVDTSWNLDMAASYAWPESTPISIVLTDLLRRLGFTPIISPISIPVGQLCRMNGTKVGAYIDQLLAVASGGPSVSLFRRYLRMSSLFSAPEYVIEPQSHITSELRKKYVLGRERTGAMISFSPLMNHRLLMTHGGGKVTSIIVDQQSKKLLRAESTMNQDVSEGPKRPIDTPTEPTLILESPFSVFQTQAAVNAIRQNTDSLSWEGTALIVGDTELMPSDYIAILVLKGGASYDDVAFLRPEDIYWFASGVWRIVEVQHTISEPTGFQTNLRLSRFGGFVGEGEAGLPLPFDFTKKIQKTSSDLMAATVAIDNPGEERAKTSITAFREVLDFIRSFGGGA